MSYLLVVVVGMVVDFAYINELEILREFFPKHKEYTIVFVLET